VGDAWIDTVRIARDFGTIDELLPDGVQDVRDCPHVWFEAIRSALVFLSFDELPKDERPPRRIWLDGEQLKLWFDDVERKREERYSNKGPGPIDDPVQNQAAKDLIVG
jgi:hypothetical protein